MSDEIERPIDDFDRHEVLHVAWMVQDMIGRYLAEHRAVAANPEWLRRVEELNDKACELYQKIGEDTVDIAAVDANRAYEARVGWEAARKTYLTSNEARARMSWLFQDVDLTPPDGGPETSGPETYKPLAEAGAESKGDNGQAVCPNVIQVSDETWNALMKALDEPEMADQDLVTLARSRPPWSKE